MAQRHRIGGRFSVFLGSTWSDNLRPEHADVVDFEAYCAAGSNRTLASHGVLNPLCCHYSDFKFALGSGGPNQVDVLILNVSPPAYPNDGYSMSTVSEYLVPLIESARLVIAEVNSASPWTYGERTLKESDIDIAVHTDRPLLNPKKTQISALEMGVARQVAKVIEDGSTLQLGIGTLPDAVLSCLDGHSDLGIHSGALSDSVATLMEQGVITNARKTLDRGLTVAGVLMGSERLHQFVHRNPYVQLRSTAYTHNPHILAAQDRFVSVNSAAQVDLTGQINTESIAGRYIGAVGGALDFIQGARLSRGGMSIIALPARAGVRSRIVAKLDGPASIPRSDVALIATEFGVADLRGCSLNQRIERMLKIADPRDRAELEAALP